MVSLNPDTGEVTIPCTRFNALCKAEKRLDAATQLLQRWGRARTGFDPYPYTETADFLSKLNPKKETSNETRT